MRQVLKTIIATGMSAVTLAGALPAQAAVVVAGTRVIYRAEDPEATVKISNQGDTPALAQTWIDKGDPKAAPSSIDVPFTVTPPVARIDQGKAQTLRILHTGEPLPTDKESVFWLNVLEVPPKPARDEASQNHMQVAIRTRVKLFFRPDGLAGNAAEAPSQLTWRLTQTSAEGKSLPAVEVHNPSPYYVSLSLVETIDGNRTASFKDGGMVGPGETKAFPLTGDVPQGQQAKVQYRAISDQGGSIGGEAALSVR